MKQNNIDFLICPVCGENLSIKEKFEIVDNFSTSENSSIVDNFSTDETHSTSGNSSKPVKIFACGRGHSFDAAREGYIHLLPSNRMNSRLPGDNREMVKARSTFHSFDYYFSLRESVCRAVNLFSPKYPLLIDCGCGEGYYTCAMKKALEDKNPRVCGIDISKEAVRIAAKRRGGDIAFVVASSFHMPVKSEAADIVTNIFSPLAADEIRRVLKNGGMMINVTPGRRHLWQMKEILYENPYMNDEEEKEYESFELIKRERVGGIIKITNQEHIKALYDMTPYRHKSSKDTSEKLKNLDCLESEVEFLVNIYRK